jgi:hypothetical protein
MSSLHFQSCPLLIAQIVEQTIQIEHVVRCCCKRDHVDADNYKRVRFQDNVNQCNNKHNHDEGNKDDGYNDVGVGNRCSSKFEIEGLTSVLKSNNNDSDNDDDNDDDMTKQHEQPLHHHPSQTLHRRERTLLAGDLTAPTKQKSEFVEHSSVKAPAGGQEVDYLQPRALVIVHQITTVAQVHQPHPLDLTVHQQTIQAQVPVPTCATCPTCVDFVGGSVCVPDEVGRAMLPSSPTPEGNIDPFQSTTH